MAIDSPVQTALPALRRSPCQEGRKRDGCSDRSMLDRRLPMPSELATLGAVLCLYRPQSGGELAGWTHAVHAEVRSALDSDGVREELVFTDREGRCCWRLWLLPDSDFLAWERLASALPTSNARRDGSHPTAGVAERLWSRLAERMRGERWQAGVLRLHALRSGPGFGLDDHPVLAASLATPSTLGASVAQRIAREAGADSSGLCDDCCCDRAARVVAARETPVHAARTSDNGDVFPLIRLNLGARR